MAVMEFTIPEQLTDENAKNIAHKVSSSVLRARFNGQSDGLIAKLELGELKGDLIAPKGQFSYGFDFWNGNTHLGDVYLRQIGNNCQVSVDSSQINDIRADDVLRHYLKIQP